MNYRTCTSCHRPLRPWGAKIADHPGTVIHRARGLCKTCDKNTPTPDTELDPQAVARTATELAGYLAWRRPYRQGVKA